MSDFDTQIRSYAGWLAEVADERARQRPDDMATGRNVAPPALRPSRRRVAVAMVAAAGLIGLVVGLVVVVGLRSDSTPVQTPPTVAVTTSPDTEPLPLADPDVVTLGPGYEVPVVGDPIEVAGVDVFQGAPAPELTAAARAEMTEPTIELPLEPLEPGEVSLDAEFVDHGVEQIVTVGRLDGTSFAVHRVLGGAAGPVRCMLVVGGTSSADWLSGCGGMAEHGALLGSSGVTGSWTFWVDVPSEAAVVELRGVNGASAHQAPIARAVAFPTDVLGEPVEQWIAYDRNGSVIATQTALAP
jgi:hypothetical protein